MEFLKNTHKLLKIDSSIFKRLWYGKCSLHPARYIGVHPMFANLRTNFLFLSKLVHVSGFPDMSGFILGIRVKILGYAGLGRF